MDKLRQQLKEVQQKQREEKQKKIKHAVGINLSKQEMNKYLNRECLNNSKIDVSFFKRCFLFTKGKEDICMMSPSHQRIFDKELVMDFIGKDGLIDCQHPSLIIIVGNRKSRKKPTIQYYQESILSQIVVQKPKQEEILLTIYGIIDNKMIDLLSINQDFGSLINKNLKIFRDQQNNVTLKNMIQIAVTSPEEYEAIITLYKSIKTLIQEQNDKKFDIIIFQFIQAKMNQDKTQVEQIRNKSNLVIIHNTQYSSQHLFNMKQCLLALSQNKLVPVNNSIFTQAISDSIKKNQNIIYVGIINSGIKLKEQANIIQFMDGFQEECTKTYQQPQKSLLDLFK